MEGETKVRKQRKPSNKSIIHSIVSLLIKEGRITTMKGKGESLKAGLKFFKTEEAKELIDAIASKEQYREMINERGKGVSRRIAQAVLQDESLKNQINNLVNVSKPKPPSIGEPVSKPEPTEDERIREERATQELDETLKKLEQEITRELTPKFGVLQKKFEKDRQQIRDLLGILENLSADTDGNKERVQQIKDEIEVIEEDSAELLASIRFNLQVKLDKEKGKSKDRTLYGNFCGAGTPINEMLNVDGVDRIDEICKKHDIDYDNASTREDVDAADALMVKRVDDVLNKGIAFGKYPSGPPSKNEAAAGLLARTTILSKGYIERLVRPFKKEDPALFFIDTRGMTQAEEDEVVKRLEDQLHLFDDTIKKMKNVDVDVDKLSKSQETDRLNQIISDLGPIFTGIKGVIPAEEEPAGPDVEQDEPVVPVGVDEPAGPDVEEEGDGIDAPLPPDPEDEPEGPEEVGPEEQPEGPSGIEKVITPTIAQRQPDVEKTKISTEGVVAKQTEPNDKIPVLERDNTLRPEMEVGGTDLVKEPEEQVVIDEISWRTFELPLETNPNAIDNPLWDALQEEKRLRFSGDDFSLTKDRPFKVVKVSQELVDRYEPIFVNYVSDPESMRNIFMSSDMRDTIYRNLSQLVPDENNLSSAHMGNPAAQPHKFDIKFD